jgi:hypothetical protein
MGWLRFSCPFVLPTSGSRWRAPSTEAAASVGFGPVAASSRCGFEDCGGSRSRSSRKTAVSAPAVPIPRRLSHLVAAGTCNGPLRFVQLGIEVLQRTPQSSRPKFEPGLSRVESSAAVARGAALYSTEPALNAPSLNIEPSLNNFEQQVRPVHSGFQGFRTATPDGYGPPPYLSPESRPVPITCRTSAFHPTPSRESSGEDARYLPSVDDTDDPIFRASRNCPERPRPELDLQRINGTRLDCMPHTSRAAPAASPTYTSRNTPPRIGFGRSRETAGCSLIRHPASSNGQEALKSRSRPWARSRVLHLTAFSYTGFFPTNPRESYADTSSRLIRTSVT